MQAINYVQYDFSLKKARYGPDGRVKENEENAYMKAMLHSICLFACLFIS